MNLGKKTSGGKYVKKRKKKLYEMPGQKRIVRLGEEKRKKKKTIGGNKKMVMLSAKKVSVLVNKKAKVVDIKNVLETPSNRFLARQNIITKGTILETELGKVKVTSRPSQHGIVQGVLMG